MNTTGGSSWELTLAPSWDAQSDTECETITNATGVGALQISAARKDTPVTDEDLAGFAQEHIDAGAKTKPVVLGSFSGMTLRYEVDGSHWRQWYLKHGAVALFVTYNCPAADKGKEDLAVDQMLSSLKARESAL